MRVIASAEGYDGTKVRQAGEEFEMPDDATGTWFAPADGGEQGDGDGAPTRRGRRKASDAGPPADGGEQGDKA